MGWGAVVDIGASVLGGVLGRDSARKQSRLAEEELAFMREQAALMNAIREQILGYLPDALENQEFLFDYVMDQNARNRLLALENQQYSRDFTERNFALLGMEQDYEKYRIDKADRLAAEEQSRQLQQLIDDEKTAKDEREKALQELDYVREIASGERDFDIRAYQADQMKAQLEYQYRQRAYEETIGVVNRERQFEIDRQERILRQAGILKNVIDEQMAGFGELVSPKRFTSADIGNFEDEFYEVFQKDADRAADRLASVNEAQLIRSGVDASGTGDSSRRRLLQENLVPLYDRARMQARQQAVSHVNALQRQEVDAFNADVGARAAAIDEALRGNTVLLEAMQALRNPQSAQVNPNIGTGILPPRQLGSAGSFQSPLQVGSEVLAPRSIGVGMDSSRNLGTSRAKLNPSAASAVTNYTLPDYLKPSAIFSYTTNTPAYGQDAFRTLVSGAGAAGESSMQNFLDAIYNIGSELEKRGY